MKEDEIVCPDCKGLAKFDPVIHGDNDTLFVIGAFQRYCYTCRNLGHVGGVYTNLPSGTNCLFTC